MKKNAIVVKDLTLSYRIINTRSLKYHGIKKAITKVENFYALDHVSFSVEKGQTVGIIGPNGAGKSTLLKVLAGIYQPDSGEVNINQNSIALLTLGAGFESRLSGYDNIYINGTLLGLSRKEIKSQIDSIIKYADIGEFIFKPVRTYSTGMRSRLAFAIASSIDPEILLLDEMLSVGDEEFKRKSREKVVEMIKKGKTVLFVSHNMSHVLELCTTAIYLNKGNIVEYGIAKDVVKKYQSNSLKK